jgi:hypothetical protein
MRAIIIAALSVFAGLGASGLVAAEPKSHPICVIAMQTDPPSGGYPFVCIDGKPYFEVSRGRQPADSPIHWPWKGQQECRFFQLTRTEGSTTIENLGPGMLDIKGQFVPDDKMTEPKPPPTGFLTADFSSDPPTVKLVKQASESSSWVIHSAQKKDEWTIENVCSSGKHAWLSLARDPTAVILGGDEKDVSEYRRAVLSYHAETFFKIDISHNDVDEK